MSRWDRFGGYPPASKKPPPKRGIKVKKVGATWWSQRWVEALEHMSLGYASRLARGRTYARAGRTHDLKVKAGEVTAKVTGSRSAPYKVRITLATLSDGAWAKAIGAMANKAQFAADLLAGRMPQEIDAAFKEAGASVFPAKSTDLQTSCSCPDWANPCKHVAATHYVLGEALDGDPFLLFELRGRTKEQVFAALSAARAHGEDGVPSRRGKGKKLEPSDDKVPSVLLGKLKLADYDKPPESLPAMSLSFEVPPVSGAVLRLLGTPASWSNNDSPETLLAPTLRAAAEEARRLASAEANGGGEVGAMTTRAKKLRRRAREE